jgi:ATP-dependent helicase HrpA
MIHIRYPEDLPISGRREDILAAIRGSQVVIIAGETGSGKTTQLPKMCLELGLDQHGKIGCTQPRRVAAMSVSKRVAEELNVPWGREVGCKMRFNDDTSRDTRLKFMTDGILLAEIQSDPMLRSYSTLILDEAHERSLNIDFLLGYLKGLLKKRPELKLIVTSATIDTAAFSAAFDNAPIIEVSGRLFPVDIRYAPLETFGSKDEDLGIIEAAAHAVEDALQETNEGDVLVFMPTERDIRETCDLLEGHLGGRVEVLGLFGRMPAAEQQRIFSPGPKRRVVIATNVAETSITIPRIRYVVDTGLARISHYNPRTRTKRLPVEAVSQSSANQRAGRAGRVQDGVCIRLYDQEDFEKRLQFTQPEIQRANLAEVILRMKAFKLGDIETFPFINPPTPAAITAGYGLLHELGAVQDTNDLTPMGRDLAKLPVDPTLGRMLLRARQEKVLPEMLVIAAGLSVPDPRERPEDAREQAAQAHRSFASPTSDFLSLLKIWQAAPDSEGKLNAMRRFCKSNFLSFTRMREWRDVYRQLADNLNENEVPVGDTTIHEGMDDAIHCSILAGLLGHIAFKQERNTYKASGNRLVTLFPGSNLYERREKQQQKPREGEAPKKPAQPGWIMAGEIVQTSQLFARMVARIEPEWILDVGAHLCQHRHSEPHWSAKAGRVLCWERTFVQGLEVRRQTIDFGKVDAKGATEMFIREVLLNRETTFPHPFIAANFRLRDKLETALMRSRTARLPDMEEAMFEFYARQLVGISSIHDLNRAIAAKKKDEPDFLTATEDDFIAADDHATDLAQFPDEVSLGNTALPVSYSYTPGGEQDGVTFQVPLAIAEHLTSGQIQWMVPGLRMQQIETLLRALPKRLRKELQPLDPKIREIATGFTPGLGDFLVELAAYISKKYHTVILVEDWPPQSLPDYLRPRVEVLDKKKQTVIVGRDLQAIRTTVEQRREVRTDAWEAALLKHERPAVNGWNFGDLPESIEIVEVGELPQRGYFGLAMREGDVDVRLFRKPEEAITATPAAVCRLAEQAMAKDLAWLAKELRGLAPRGGASKPAGFHDALSQMSAKLLVPSVNGNAFASDEFLQESAYQHLAAHVFRLEPVLPLKKDRFEAMLVKAKKDLPALAHRVRELVGQCYDLQQKIAAATKRYAGMEQDLARLLPSDLLLRTPHAQLIHLPRYLKALLLRGERAVLSPAKDEDKQWQMDAFKGWESQVPADKRETFRWMLEEYRVQIFAQELGTVGKVSEKRLKEFAGWE